MKKIILLSFLALFGCTQFYSDDDLSECRCCVQSTTSHYEQIGRMFIAKESLYFYTCPKCKKEIEENPETDEELTENIQCI